MTESTLWKLGVVQSATLSRSPAISKNPQFSQPPPMNCDRSRAGCQNWDWKHTGCQAAAGALNDIRSTWHA